MLDVLTDLLHYARIASATRVQHPRVRYLTYITTVRKLHVSCSTLDAQRSGFDTPLRVGATELTAIWVHPCLPAQAPGLRRRGLATRAQGSQSPGAAL